MKTFLVFFISLCILTVEISCAAPGGITTYVTKTRFDNFSATTESKFSVVKAAKADKSSPIFQGTVTVPILKLGTTAITATGSELNKLVGLIPGTVQSQLDSKASLISPTFSGSVNITGSTAITTGAYNVFRVRKTSDNDILFDIDPNTELTQAKKFLILALPPETPADSGAVGEIRLDQDYIYVKVFGSWKRAALTAY